MVQEQLLMSVAIPEENIHRVPAEAEIRMAAFQYEEELRSYFDGEWPRFDLILLGMGEDGHTASLFPCSAGLNEEQRWFIANFAPQQETWRLTLTKNAINGARQIMVVVQGENKAAMLSQVLMGERDPQMKPIQLIEPKDGKMIWLLDQQSAKFLPEKFLE
jgi:6-phosphogluconolactonase